MARKFLTWNFTIVYVIYVLSFVQCEDEKVMDTPITYDDINYKQFWKICASWSGTERKSDWSSSYPVATYTKYASTIDEFMAKYPFVSIETSFRATSAYLTSDEQVPYHHETLTYETRDFFLKKEYTDRYAVYVHRNGWDGGGHFDVGAETGFGFRSENNILYVEPFINGWIYKSGMYQACLEFGLSASSITFNPKHPNDV